MTAEGGEREGQEGAVRGARGESRGGASQVSENFAREPLTYEYVESTAEYHGKENGEEEGRERSDEQGGATQLWWMLRVHDRALFGSSCCSLDTRAVLSRWNQDGFTAGGKRGRVYKQCSRTPTAHLLHFLNTLPTRVHEHDQNHSFGK